MTQDPNGRTLKLKKAAPAPSDPNAPRRAVSYTHLRAHET